MALNNSLIDQLNALSERLDILSLLRNMDDANGYLTFKDGKWCCGWFLDEYAREFSADKFEDAITQAYDALNGDSTD